MSDARFSAISMYPLGYPQAIKAGETGFIEAAFRGIPDMKEGKVITKATDDPDAETAPIMRVWCHRAQAMLTTFEARERYLPNGASDLTTACGICTCCLN